MENNLKNKLKSGYTVYGLGNHYPAAGIIEGMCKEWDFVWIDGQHGQHAQASIVEAVRTARSIGIASIVRVPGQESHILGVTADITPEGIMVPMVNTRSEADQIMKNLLFSPHGTRSYGGRRPVDLFGRDYFKDSYLLTVLQIETLAGLQNVESIAETDGLDCLFFGPDDMKLQMGLPVESSLKDTKELQSAMIRIAEAARTAGICTGCVAVNQEAITMAQDLGYQLIVAGIDAVFLRNSAKQQREVTASVSSKNSSSKS